MQSLTYCRKSTSQRGFTLVETIIVVVLLGIVAAIVSTFIVMPVRGYLDTVARVELVDATDNALRRIGRDLRIALPNSVRVSANGLTLELIPTTAGGRYYQADSTTGSQRLTFGAADTDGFSVMSPGVALTSGQDLVFYNLGDGAVESDAYAPVNTAVSNRRSYAGATGPVTGVIATGSWAALPVAARSPPYRFQAVGQPVTYHCDLAAATMRRYTGYGFNPTQVAPPTGGVNAVLATGVTACAFSYESKVVASRSGLVGLGLTLTATSAMGGPESVSLYHSIHVDNLP